MFLINSFPGPFEVPKVPELKIKTQKWSKISEVNHQLYISGKVIANLQISGENQNFLTSSWRLLTAKNWTLSGVNK